MPFNLHAAFYRTGDDHCYHQRIAATRTDREELDVVSKTVRAALRTGIPLWLEQRPELKMEAKQSPKFRPQGSWVYKTCNRPEQLPPQEVDLDDGVYLPLSMWKESEVPANYGAAVFFRMIEEIVGAVCKAKGWKMESKDTCVRVKIPGKPCHVDFPLYVAPDQQFRKVVESAAKTMRGNVVDAASPNAWEHLQHIALAHRDGKWRYSDPEKVRLWFEQCVEVYGEQLRRLVRYLKAWRDTKWQNGGPSSLLLMACAAKVLGSKALNPMRDDEALLSIAEKLPELLRSAMTIPPTGAEDLNRLDAAGRELAARYAQELCTDLRYSMRQLGKGMESIALSRLTTHFGRRFPIDPARVQLDVAQAVRASAALPVAQPRTMPSTSG